MLPRVAIAARRAAAPAIARRAAAVHPAPRLALHRRGLARLARTGASVAARGLCQPRRLHGVVRLVFHFLAPRWLALRDGGIDRQ